MEKKTIVITGSTRGIGFGLATEFLKAGQQIVINGRRTEAVEKAINQLQKISPEVTGVAGDVSQPETHTALVNKAVEVFGKVDIWINNAGIPQPHQKFTEVDNEAIRNITDINIFGLMLGSKTAINFMLKQGFGKVFNMEGFGSDGRMMDKLSLYGTTKRAVNYFTKAVSKEMEGRCVQIGILSPGMVRTEFLDGANNSRSPEELKRFRKVYQILSEDPEVVTAFLVPRILSSTKHYDRIEFLTKGRLMVRLFKMMIS